MVQHITFPVRWKTAEQSFMKISDDVKIAKSKYLSKKSEKFINISIYVLFHKPLSFSSHCTIISARCSSFSVQPFTKVSSNTIYNFWICLKIVWNVIILINIIASCYSGIWGVFLNEVFNHDLTYYYVLHLIPQFTKGNE